MPEMNGLKYKKVTKNRGMLHGNKGLTIFFEDC